MSKQNVQPEWLEMAWRFAHVLTGCGEGASRALDETVGEIRRHPQADEQDRFGALFLSALRRRCLKFPARCELSGPLADLHRQTEPGRSAQVLRNLNLLSAADVARVLTVDERSVGEPDPELSTALAELPVESATQEKLTAAREALAGSGGSHRLRNPAALAVGVGFLLLIAVLVWNFLGRAGTFPDDAAKVAAAGGRAAPTQFDEIQEKAADLADWFMLKGFDDFRLPAGFGTFDVVGVRLFRVEDENIAQAAVLGDFPIFFYSFRSQPFGITVFPEGSWITTESEGWALALREEKGVCFLVAVRGGKNDLRRVLEKAGVR